MRTLLQTAATVAITFLVSILLLGKDPLPEPGMLSLEVPTGQRIHVTLPDGTSVWLNSCSKMEYPGIFTEKSREITLDGEAYFEVKHQPGKPFVVHTVYGDIEVLGTTFNVEAYSQDGSFTTSLLEGSVQVIRDEEILLLAPNQVASLSEGKLTISPLTDLHTYRWKEGLICFDNESFGQILKKLEKYYNIQIHLQPGTDTSRKYSGKFRQEDGIEAALKILQKDLRFTYTREPGRPIIHIK
ncbi:MAG: FecR domain-containing protein [Bacteroides sp.]|nr:FecR domain-containing protein [Bacteroides sp.]